MDQETAQSQAAISWRYWPHTFAQRASEGRWRPYNYLKLISEQIIASLTVGNGRLMVLMPPRHGKSEFISHWLPVWFLENFPQKRIILSTYEADFAAQWGRKVRNTLQENPHCITKLTGDSTAAHRWDTIEGGSMVTAGIGGPIAGRGGDLIIIDDPVKNWEEASSTTIQERNLNWYKSTLYTRAEPGAMIILLMTRWHDKDLAGTLIRESSDNWSIVKLKALATADDPLDRKPNEALCPERFPVNQLLKIRAAIGWHWHGLYQQEPVDIGESFFKTAEIGLVDDYPREAKVVRFWDLAGTEDTGRNDPSWTAGVKMAHADGIFYICHVRRMRETPGSVKQAVKQTAEFDGVKTEIGMEQEPGSSGKAVVEEYTRYLSAFSYKGIPSTGSKQTRAMPLATQVEAKNVKMIVGSWNQDFIDELSRYPRGDHDDQVDAASGAYNMLTSEPVMDLDSILTLGDRVQPDW